MFSIRYLPEVPFPPYAFVPGKHPHPVTDCRGHSFGRLHSTPEPLDPLHPRRSTVFLSAIDLFNAGFYWEAHEAWEGLWIVAGRRGCLADFLKSLIKLAAAGVKARAGEIEGVKRHTRRAVELLLAVQDQRPGSERIYCDVFLSKLIRDASQLVEHPVTNNISSIEGMPVLSFQITLECHESPEKPSP